MMSQSVRSVVSAGVGFSLLVGCAGKVSNLTPSLQPNPLIGESRAASGYRVLYSFGNHANDGINPTGNLTLLKGILYGVTIGGPGSMGSGTVFGVRTSGGEAVSCELRGASRPTAGLIAVSDTLYGTSQYGGAAGRGTVFATGPKCKPRVIYSFQRGSDGKRPSARLLDVDGTLYGTTEFGGNLHGTAFSVSASGKEQVLHRFQSGGNGAINPTTGLTDDRGTLYGTTGSASGSADGTVYSLTKTGEERVIYRFPGREYDGSNPASELVNVNGVLYGTTPYGGRFGLGTIFSVTTGGKEQVLYSFAFWKRTGVYPGPIIYANGRFYGTTSEGGKNDLGTIYSFSTTGQAKALYDFDAQYPNDLLYDKGVLYGTTSHGGAYGQGAVFALPL